MRWAVHLGGQARVRFGYASAVPGQPAVVAPPRRPQGCRGRKGPPVHARRVAGRIMQGHLDRPSITLLDF
jgi:hypothetical protein